MVSALLLAQAIPAPYDTLTQYGIAGVLLVLLIRRYEAELAKVHAAKEKAEAQRDALTERAASETIPLLGEVQRTMVPTLNNLTNELKRMGDRLERVERTVADRDHQGG